MNIMRVTNFFLIRLKNIVTTRGRGLSQEGPRTYKTSIFCLLATLLCPNIRQNEPASIILSPGSLFFAWNNCTGTWKWGEIKIFLLIKRHTTLYFKNKYYYNYLPPHSLQLSRFPLKTNPVSSVDVAHVLKGVRQPTSVNNLPSATPFKKKILLLLTEAIIFQWLLC